MTLEVPDAKLARTITEAAFDPAKWVDVCDGLARLTGCDGGCVLAVESAQRALGIPRSRSLDGMLGAYLDGGWYMHDLRERGIPKMYRQGYLTDADCIAYDSINRSPYYQDFLGANDFRWFAGFGFGAGKSKWIMTVQRNLRGEPFAGAEIGKILAYRNHLSNTAEISRQLGFAAMGGSVHILEQQGFGAIAFDIKGRVVLVSPTAERYLGDGLQISGGRITAMIAAGAPPLARLIAAICSRNYMSVAEPIAIPRPAGGASLILHGCRLPDSGCDVFRPAIGLLVITDPQVPRHTSINLLTAYFGLTPTEAQLAQALMTGTSIDQYAELNAVSRLTVRNQMHSLFRKTETHRQGELIAALNRVSQLFRSAPR